MCFVVCRGMSFMPKNVNITECNCVLLNAATLDTGAISPGGPGERVHERGRLVRRPREAADQRDGDVADDQQASGPEGELPESLYNGPQKYRELHEVSEKVQWTKSTTKCNGRTPQRPRGV